MGTMEGRTALVTGAARGIGLGIAKRLAREGAHVVLADRGDPGGGAGDPTYQLAGSQELAAAAEEVGELGPGEAFAISCDVTQADAVLALLARTQERFGGLDLLVNNAGVVHFERMRDFSEARWDHVFAVNVKGVFLVSRAAIPALVASEGAIVNIASVAGKRGHPLGTAYCGSKFAVVGITQSLAAELAPEGVRVNAVCPGILGTHMWTHHLTSEERGGEQAYAAAIQSMVPLGREQTPEDIADAVVYLAAATNVTGVALNVAGGMEFA